MTAAVAFTAGIGAVSALILWWYNDRTRFRNAWNWALGGVPVPEFTPSAPLSQNLQKRLENNVRLAAGRKDGIGPRRVSEEAPRDISQVNISNKTIAYWWSTFYIWALQTVGSTALRSAFFAAVPTIVPLAVLAVCVAILCGTSCRWALRQGLEFLMFIKRVFFEQDKSTVTINENSIPNVNRPESEIIEQIRRVRDGAHQEYETQAQYLQQVKRTMFGPAQDAP
jgi:hypothetical protein